MTNKDLTKKLSYKELSEEIVEICLNIQKNEFHFNKKYTQKLQNLRRDYLTNYNKYQREEQIGINEQFKILDQTLSDTLL